MSDWDEDCEGSGNVGIALQMQSCLILGALPCDAPALTPRVPSNMSQKPLIILPTSDHPKP